MILWIPDNAQGAVQRKRIVRSKRMTSTMRSLIMRPMTMTSKTFNFRWKSMKTKKRSEKTWYQFYQSPFLASGSESKVVSNQWYVLFLWNGLAFRYFLPLKMKLNSGLGRTSHQNGVGVLVQGGAWSSRGGGGPHSPCLVPEEKGETEIRATKSSQRGD